MKKLILLVTVVGVLLGVTSTFAQIDGFGDRAVELRGISSDELAKPDIPTDAVANNPTNATVPRPIYLVYRYYSCIPWLAAHVRSVVSTVPGFNPANVVVDTANDNPSLQLVSEANEARLELSPGTAATHPAYGLYCLKVVICLPYDQWVPGLYHRFYIRLHYRHPYICWSDHWWYYWRTPLYAFRVTINSSQEVPPNSSPATGSGTLFLEPIYKTICYDINYAGLVANFSAAHIHGPAGPGTNAGVIFPLVNYPANGTNTRAGRLFGSTAALTTTQVSNLRNGLQYVNIHSVGAFSGGEIRGQIQAQPTAVYCPWRPSWIPLARWGRGGPIWCLTVTHPYGYKWDPWHTSRPFCLYGLRYYFTPIGSVRTPAQVPYIGSLSFNTIPVSPWLYYPYRPTYKYWPYSPYCARWYWWQCTPFSVYRHLPPVVQYATYVNPDLTDPPITTDFPDDPIPIPGTTGVSTLRALVSQQGDLTGDGFENLSDLSAFKQEQGTASQDTVDTDGP